MYTEILTEKVRLSKSGKVILPVVIDNTITPVFLSPESANKLFRALDENLRNLRGKEK